MAETFDNGVQIVSQQQLTDYGIKNTYDTEAQPEIPQQSKLFNVLPQSFFSIFSSPRPETAKIYERTTMLLYKICNENKATETDTYKEYLIECMKEDDKLIQLTGGAIQDTSKCTEIINRFEFCGWININNNSFSNKDIIVFTSPAQMLMTDFILKLSISDVNVEIYEYMLNISSHLRGAFDPSGVACLDFLNAAMNELDKSDAKFKYLDSRLNDIILKINSAKTENLMLDILQDYSAVWQESLKKISQANASSLMDIHLNTIDNELLKTPEQKNQELIKELRKEYFDKGKDYDLNKIDEIYTNKLNLLKSKLLNFMQNLSHSHKQQGEVYKKANKKYDYLSNNKSTTLLQFQKLLRFYGSINEAFDLSNFETLFISNISLPLYFEHPTYLAKPRIKKNLSIQSISQKKPHPKSDYFSQLLPKIRNSLSISQVNKYVLNLLQSSNRFDCKNFIFTNDFDHTMFLAIQGYSKNNDAIYKIVYTDEKINHGKFTYNNYCIIRKEEE